MALKYMEICVGSTNRKKIESVEEIIQDYPHLKDARVFSVDVVSGVKDQPTSLDETLSGAINRAKSSFNNCTYSIGLKSGLFSVAFTKSGYMDVCVCAIFDGENIHLGLSSAWEPPEDVVFILGSLSFHMVS